MADFGGFYHEGSYARVGLPELPNEEFLSPEPEGKSREGCPVASKPPRRPKQEMFAAGCSWKGQSHLNVVDSKAKVNAYYFIEKISSPIVLIDVPRLYGADSSNVILHMDSASSLTS